MGKESFFSEYVDGILPTASEMAEWHPAYAQQSGIDLPDGWNAWKELFTKVDTCFYHYANTPSAQPEAGALSVDRQKVRDAYVQVASRAYPEVYLAPFLDMVNMGTNNNVQHSFETADKDSVCIQATKEIKAGEELLIDYGMKNHDMWSFFTQYGFALGQKGQYKKVNEGAVRSSCKYFFDSEIFRQWFGDANYVAPTNQHKAWINIWSKLCNIRTAAYLQKKKAQGVDMGELRRKIESDQEL